MTRSERLYRMLLRAYPEATRAAYGEDMVQAFRDQLRVTRTRGDRAELWLHTIADTATSASRARAADRRRMARAGGGEIAAIARPLGLDLAVASLPLVLFATLALAAPGFMTPMFDDRAQLAGAPFGLAVSVLLGIVAITGILLARRGGLRGDTALLTLAVLCVPVPVMIWVYGPVEAVGYALLMTGVALAMRSRWLMLAATIPFFAWLVFGPAIVVILIQLGSSAQD
ncbi:MAG TPA: hypothetical protein VGK17_20265 [Propionicimonas sp.]|jgi:hypothetical protein